MKLFLSKKSLHTTKILLHYNGIRHELNYPDHKPLSDALKVLVKSNKLHRVTHTYRYRTSIFTLVKMPRSITKNFHSQIEKSISTLNFSKGEKLELLIKRVVSKISKRTTHKFKLPKDGRVHFDVYSDDYCIESKNHDRSQQIGEREVKKFLNVKARFSNTLLTINRKFFFIASTLTVSAKKMLTDHGIKFIEIGFQVLSWSDRSAYKKLFDLISANCPKSYPNVDTDEKYNMFRSQIFYFILAGLKFAKSKNRQDWRYTIQHVPIMYRKKLLGDLG